LLARLKQVAVHSRSRVFFAVAATLALAVAALFVASGQSLAEGNAKNETGLPLYPNAKTGTQYPPSTTKGKTFSIYTAESEDSLAAVEDWYRHALPQAKETKDESGLTHGIVLTIGNDKVLVYQLGKRPGAVMELHKYIHG
jgi:hypothetical protein